MVGWGGVIGAAGAAIGVPEAGLAASTGEAGAGIGRSGETGPQPGGRGGHMQ
jgi:hypothetical protein